MIWKVRGPQFFRFGRFTAEANAARWNTRRAGADVFVTPCADGYMRTSILGHPVVLHRVKWAMHYGRWPNGLLDHIDGNPRNNSIHNLREASVAMNARNAKKSKTNTSGITGVRFHKIAKKWYAQITVNGKAIHLGTFDTRDDAAAAKMAANAKYGFTERHGT